MPAWQRLWRQPWQDLLGGLEACLTRGARGLAWIGLGLVVGWWLTVPLHELSHALACLAAGGSVTRLEIDALYGGRLLAGWIPFVVPASEYAGRLSGFDTGGRDLVYLATDLGPYLWTLFPGVWALRRCGRRGWGLLFGLVLPLGLAPFLSLTGDAYEIGSLAVTALPPWSSPAERALIVGDDLLRRADALLGAGAGAPWGGFLLAALLGALWAFAWYAAAAALARLLGEEPLAGLRPGGSPPASSSPLA